MHAIARFALLASAALLAACASSHVLVGTARAPIPVDDVRVYLTPPETFEEVALLEADNRGNLSFTAQGHTDAVIRRLKKEAASLGANGIIFGGIHDQQAGSVNTSYATAHASGNRAYATGTGVSAPIMVKSGTALAIYVAE